MTEGANGPSRGLICPHCARPTVAAIRGQAVWDGYDAEGEPQNPPVEYSLLQCARCGDVCVQLREDYGGGFHQDEPVVVYPEPKRLSWSVPAPLRQEWDEARACLDAKAYAACLVMVRRTIEGTCQENGVSKRNLVEGLRELHSQGLIDGTLAEWANALRLAGNKGAHYTGRPVPREDAEHALAFAEALLDHIYVLRKRFEAFKERLAAKQRASTEPNGLGGSVES